MCLSLGKHVCACNDGKHRPSCGAPDGLPSGLCDRRDRFGWPIESNCNTPSTIHTLLYAEFMSVLFRSCLNRWRIRARVQECEEVRDTWLTAQAFLRQSRWRIELGSRIEGREVRPFRVEIRVRMSPKARLVRSLQLRQGFGLKQVSHQHRIQGNTGTFPGQEMRIIVNKWVNR